jgi:peptide chain release factor 3
VSDRIVSEASRRRTFAIISHPDAGKTTLTEKFLLYAGAVQRAGAVHAREGGRSATSDWMEMEQKRGISITSTVLQFDYRDCVINLLDTPGHRDFSEDTYRVLTAVDAVIMVLDSAKGIEAQTRKLFEVCRVRELPIITFLNKMDRPGRSPLELLDEIEEQLILYPTPVTWPVGESGDFRGVIDRRTNNFHRFTRTARGATIAAEEILSAADAEKSEGRLWTAAMEDCSLLDEMGQSVNEKTFRDGTSTPVFCGSALTNFGIGQLLDAVVDLVPSPSARLDIDNKPRQVDQLCSGFVFKMQANMDPSHRDRIAFVRLISGRFERGMNLTRAASGKPFNTKYATTVFGADRDTVEEAYPGDIVGLINARDLRIGDTLYEGEAVVFPPIPTFDPEVFTTVRPKDTGRFKQFRSGLAQLDDEGVVQVLRDPDFGDQAPILAAVGSLQFDVFSHRLEHEFGAPVDMTGSPYVVARRTDAATAADLRGLVGVRVVNRSDGSLVALFESKYRMERLISDNPSWNLARMVAGLE